MRFTKFTFSLWFIIRAMFLTLSAQNIITTVAGNGIGGYTGNGSSAIFSELNNPVGIIIDKKGNMYFADASNNVLRKIDTLGVINTIGGTGVAGYSGDGGSSTSAELNIPADVTIDDTGNILLVDYGNTRIRKISTTGIITTIAGTGVAGYSGDNGLAINAKINYPTGIAVDRLGNILIADYFNNVVRKINVSGIITTIAGTGTPGFSGDNGSALVAKLNLPQQITVDSSGNIYIADVGNDRIRKINSSGIITTIAGTGVSGYSGDGGQAVLAKLNAPYGMVFDFIGNLYFVDASNNVVRKIDTSGIISTIAGNGLGGYSGDGGPATSSELNVPIDLSFDHLGNLIISDQKNNRIRKVSNVTVSINEIRSQEINLSVYPNPNIGAFVVKYTGKGKQMSIVIYNTLGALVVDRQFVIEDNSKTTEIDNLVEGVYMIKVRVDDAPVRTEKIIVTK
jgi:hypothetical protein